MQFLFKRSKKRPESNGTAMGNSLATYLEKGYLYAQSKWAQWMTKQTAKLSFASQLVIWGFFIACVSGYSIYLIGISFSDSDSNTITVTPIVKPVKTFSTDDRTINKNSSVSKIELDKIIRFRAYIDSLARSPTGKRVLDSITDKRPRLLDSLAGIEHYYQSNFKNYYYGK